MDKRTVPTLHQIGLFHQKGGEDSDLGEFPWMVLLRRERPNNRIWWHCGGALINQWFVITAAHCGPTIDYVRKHL